MGSPSVVALHFTAQVTVSTADKVAPSRTKAVPWSPTHATPNGRSSPSARAAEATRLDEPLAVTDVICGSMVVVSHSSGVPPSQTVV